MEELSTKKRMMFIKDEDYNFLAYNIFIILNGLGCTKGKSILKDHRKLSFLVDFVANGKLIDIIEKSNRSKTINDVDREILNHSYTNALLRVKIINQLIFTLNNEYIIEVSEKGLERLNISLNKNNIDKEFFSGDLFKIERNNLNRLKKEVQRITIIDLSNMLNQLYYNHGILDEQIFS